MLKSSMKSAEFLDFYWDKDEEEFSRKQENVKVSLSATADLKPYLDFLENFAVGSPEDTRRENHYPDNPFTL
jgi:hypothetical protein